MGFKLEAPKRVKVESDQSWESSVIHNVTKEENLQLLVFVLPSNAENRYQLIKKVCALKRPVASQCVCEK